VRDLLGRGGQVRLLAGDYLGITGLPRRSLGEGGSPTRSYACSTCSKEPPARSTCASWNPKAEASTAEPVARSRSTF
jgi:hypothetical protein